MTDDSARLAEIKQWLDTIRRDVFAERYGLPRHAEHVAWLLARLEQAERERDAAQFVQRFGTPFDPTGAKSGSEILSLRAHLAEAEARLEQAERERDALVVALCAIRSELGVPQPGYPAPVANAVEIAEQALRGTSTPRTGK